MHAAWLISDPETERDANESDSRHLSDDCNVAARTRRDGRHVFVSRAKWRLTMQTIYKANIERLEVSLKELEGIGSTRLTVTFGHFHKCFCPQLDKK